MFNTTTSFLALLLLATPIFATETPVKSTVREVTVYRSGARLSSVANVRLESGKNEIVFENLSPYVNGNSLQVKIGGGATLESAVFRAATPGPAPENPRVRVIQDSTVLLNDESAKIADARTLLQSEAGLLEKNAGRIGVSGQNGAVTLTTQEIIAFAEFYRRRNAEIKADLQKLALSERKLGEQRQRLARELERLQPINTIQTGEIVLKIEAESARTVEITCTYLVSEAGWHPVYDLRTSGLGKPLELVYKANVQNRSGFDWKNVKISLSTAQPLVNNNRPVLAPLFIDFRPATVLRDKSQSKKLEEVVNMKAARSDAPNYYIDGDRVQGSTFPVQDIEDAGNVVNFDIPKPQDIPANGKEYLLTVDRQEIPAEYEYHAVPKLEPAVFLLAKVTDYGRYNLLPGVANLFFADNFIGQATLNPQVTSDTLLLSLGRDEQIAVKRSQPKDFRERTRIFGNSVKETSTFEIEVKNNKPVAVTVNLLDQIPVSKQEAIKVEIEEKDGARYAPELGKLEWNLEVPPGKSKKVRFTYTVEHAKGQSVLEIRG